MSTSVSNYGGLQLPEMIEIKEEFVESPDIKEEPKDDDWDHHLFHTRNGFKQVNVEEEDHFRHSLVRVVSDAQASRSRMITPTGTNTQLPPDPLCLEIFSSTKDGQQRSNSVLPASPSGQDVEPVPSTSKGSYRESTILRELLLMPVPLCTSQHKQKPSGHTESTSTISNTVSSKRLLSTSVSKSNGGGSSMLPAAANIMCAIPREVAMKYMSSSAVSEESPNAIKSSSEDVAKNPLKNDCSSHSNRLVQKEETKNVKSQLFRHLNKCGINKRQNGSRITSAPKNSNQLKNNCSKQRTCVRRTIKRDVKSTIKGDIKSTIKGDVKSTIKGDVKSTIKGDVKSTIKGDVKSTIKGDVKSTVKGDVKSTIKGNKKEHVGCNGTNSSMGGKVQLRRSRRTRSDDSRAGDRFVDNFLVCSLCEGSRFWSYSELTSHKTIVHPNNVMTAYFEMPVPSPISRTQSTDESRLSSSSVKSKKSDAVSASSDINENTSKVSESSETIKPPKDATVEIFEDAALSSSSVDVVVVREIPRHPPEVPEEVVQRKEPKENVSLGPEVKTITNCNGVVKESVSLLPCIVPEQRAQKVPSDNENTVVHCDNASGEEGIKSKTKNIEALVEKSDSLANIPVASVKGRGPRRDACGICEFCGKVFTHTGDCNKHRRSHTRERPLTCNYRGCGMTFTTHSNLSRHRKGHEGIKYTCPVCNVTYSRQDKLASHSKVHSSGKVENKRKSGETVVGSGVVGLKKLKASRNSPGTPAVTESKELWQGVMLGCRICSKIFGNASDFVDHMNRHSENCPVEGPKTLSADAPPDTRVKSSEVTPRLSTTSFSRICHQ